MPTRHRQAAALSPITFSASAARRREIFHAQFQHYASAEERARSRLRDDYMPPKALLQLLLRSRFSVNEPESEHAEGRKSFSMTRRRHRHSRPARMIEGQRRAILVIKNAFD